MYCGTPSLCGRASSFSEGFVIAALLNLGQWKREASTERRCGAKLLFSIGFLSLSGRLIILNNMVAGRLTLEIKGDIIDRVERQDFWQRLIH